MIYLTLHLSIPGGQQKLVLCPDPPYFCSAGCIASPARGDAIHPALQKSGGSGCAPKQKL